MAKHMKPAKIRCAAFVATMLLAVMAACDGSSSVGNLDNRGRLTLQQVQLGRLVDIYAYQRIDESNGDRRQRDNRRIVLIATNVVVNPNIETQPLFDAVGNEVTTATYEYRPFNKRVGHEELLILWDNRSGPEEERFKLAFEAAQIGLIELAPAYRGQNTLTNPIPVVPRNAAIQLVFDSEVTVDEEFFIANPGAIELLEFKGDPGVVDPADAFRIVPRRILPNGRSIVLDTTILGGEANGGTSWPACKR
jgi:hypothetical protein